MEARFDASEAPSPINWRTFASLPGSAPFTASRNAFAFSGSMARRIGPSSFRNWSRSPASWVWAIGITEPSWRNEPFALPGYTYRNRWPSTFLQRIDTTVSAGSLTAWSTSKVTSAWPPRISAPVTLPTSTPASFTASPLNTPDALANTACSRYVWANGRRFPILAARARVNRADTRAKATTLKSVARENRIRRALTASPSTHRHMAADVQRERVADHRLAPRLRVSADEVDEPGRAAAARDGERRPAQLQ